MLPLMGLAVVLVACSCGVSRSQYDEAQAQIAEVTAAKESLGQERDAVQASLVACQAEAQKVKADNASLARGKEVAEGKLAVAAQWSAVLDVLMSDIVVPSMQQAEQGSPEELLAVLKRQVAASESPDLQAMLDRLLAEAQKGAVPSEMVGQFDAMVRASGRPELIAAWEQLLAATGGMPEAQPDPLRLMEDAIRAAGDATLIGKMELFKQAMQAGYGMPIMSLVELVEAVEASGNQQLIATFNQLLEQRTGGGPFAMGGLVRLGKAVRAAGDPTLEGMLRDLFGGDTGEAFLNFMTYTTEKLAEALH